MYVYNSMIGEATAKFPGVSLKIGSRGNDVATMQRYLNAIAAQYTTIPHLTADGIFGSGTQASVVAFQKQHSLTADGIIGKNTWDKIISVYNMLAMNTASVSAFAIESAGVRGNNFNNLALLYAFSRFIGY